MATRHRLRWRLWIDTGGTFTDAVGIDPRGRRHVLKVLSSSAVRARLGTASGRRLRLAEPWTLPDGFFAGCTLRSADVGGPQGAAPATVVGSVQDGGLELDVAVDLVPGSTVELRFALEAPVLAAHWMTATPPGRPLPEMALRLATTRGTNALLERRGEPPAFFVTAGFGDLLRIGDQRRPELFALAVERPPPLYARVVEVAERLAADGSAVLPFDPEELAPLAAAARRDGCRSAAVALLHSWRDPAHERAVTDVLEREGFTHVSRSSDLAPTIKILPRAETAVVDAYLAPIIGRYLGRVASTLPAGTAVHVMTSAGGLVRAGAYRSKDSLLSGPAGGVVGAAAAGRAAGFARLIAFDMGGTSTDVSRFAGDLSYRFEHRVGDATVAAPALLIETVAAGGGSICRADGDRLRVGPESAGADPGPACYGAGGPLTLTDVNLLLGRLDPAHIGIPIDPQAARAAFRAMRGALAEATMVEADGDEGDALLAGCLAIADERMAEAIRRISVRRGFDPADHALVAFGGAGGQHACAVAARLGIGTIVLPPAAGLLSAVGLGEAVLERFAVRQVLEALDGCAHRLTAWLGDLDAEALAALGEEGVGAADRIVRQRRADLRLAGQEATLEIDPVPALASDQDPGAALAAAFAERYRAVYGYPPPARPLEVVALRAIASERRLPPASAAEQPETRTATPSGHRRAYLGGRWQDVPTYELTALRPGDRFAGPALVFDPHATLVVEEGWSASVVASGAVVCRQDSPSPDDRSVTTRGARSDEPRGGDSG